MIMSLKWLILRVAPNNKAKPQRALIIIIAGFLGGIIGLIVVLYRSGKQSHLARKLKK